MSATPKTYTEAEIRRAICKVMHTHDPDDGCPVDEIIEAIHTFNDWTPA